MSEAREHLEAGRAAIGAAIRSAGPTMDVGDLLAAIVALVVTQPGYTQDAAHILASRLVVEVVRLVGARRAHELVDVLASKGADLFA